MNDKDRDVREHVLRQLLRLKLKLKEKTSRDGLDR